jgi:hypothetical protein
LILLLRSGEGSVKRHKLSISFRLLVQAHDGDDISQIPGLCFSLLSISEAPRCSELVRKLSIQLFPMQRLIQFVRIRNEVWAPDTQRTVIASWTEPSPTTVAKVRGVDRPPSLKDSTQLFIHLLQNVLVWHRDLQSGFAFFYR